MSWSSIFNFSNKFVLLHSGGASINALYIIYALKIMYLFDFEPNVFVRPQVETCVLCSVVNLVW
jgi:hypothetical protein